MGRDKAAGSADRKERFVRESVFVFSLEHGAGTSYIAAAIANYISGVKKGNVSFFTGMLGNERDYLLPKVSCVSLRNGSADRTYVNADHVVYDGGVYGDMDAVCKDAMFRVETRVLVCQADTEYLERLADFLERNGEGDDFIYLFNVLPPEWEKRVEAAMDSYRGVYFLPIFYAKKLPQEVSDIMLGIFGRG